MNKRDHRHKSPPRNDAADGPRSRSPGGRDARPPGGRDADRVHSSGSFWLFGTHAVLAALGNPQRKIRRLLMTAEAGHSHAGVLAGLRSGRTFPGEEIAQRVDIDRLLPPGAVHQGIAALVEPLPATDLNDLARVADQREHAVVMVLDQVTDPHNVGAILRSAAAFGALAVIVPDRHSPDETGTLAKSASGALERLPLVRVTNVVRALDELKEAGFWVAGMAGEATATLASAKLSGKIALVMGAEGEGLRRLTREHCDYLVKLPMTDAVESLNVSNAAAVALYELVRDRL